MEPAGSPTLGSEVRGWGEQGAPQVQAALSDLQVAVLRDPMVVSGRSSSFPGELGAGASTDPLWDPGCPRTHSTLVLWREAQGGTKTLEVCTNSCAVARARKFVHVRWRRGFRHCWQSQGGPPQPGSQDELNSLSSLRRHRENLSCFIFLSQLPLGLELYSSRPAVGSEIVSGQRSHLSLSFCPP